MKKREQSNTQKTRIFSLYTKSPQKGLNLTPPKKQADKTPKAENDPKEAIEIKKVRKHKNLTK